MVSSDLTVAQADRNKFTTMLALGYSKSSMTGQSSWGVSAIIWSDLQQFALSGRTTLMNFKDGKLKSIGNYSITGAYVANTKMLIGGYTYIKPTKKIGVVGANFGLIGLALPESYSFVKSLTGFWTKPVQLTPRHSISPGVFVMSAPVSYSTSSGWNLSDAFSVMGGVGYNLRISKKFSIACDYKLNVSSVPGTPALSFMLIGSKIML